VTPSRGKCRRLVRVGCGLFVRCMHLVHSLPLFPLSQPLSFLLALTERTILLVSFPSFSFFSSFSFPSSCCSSSWSFPSTFSTHPLPFLARPHKKIFQLFTFSSFLIVVINMIISSTFLLFHAFCFRACCFSHRLLRLPPLPQGAACVPRANGMALFNNKTT